MAGLATKEEYDGMAEAVSLGITILKRTKKNSWPELAQAMSTADPAVTKVFRTLELNDRQLDAVNGHQGVLNLVRITPAVTPVICPECSMYVLTADTAPTRCLVTVGCTGKPFKVAAAVTSKEPVAVSQPAPVAEAPSEVPTPAPADDEPAPAPVADAATPERLELEEVDFD